MIDFSVIVNAVVEHFQIPVLLACLGVGYVIKKWVKDIDNKYIPTINFFLGGILNMCLVGFSIENAIYGSIAGLASTGLHQAFTLLVESNRKEANPE